MVALGDHAAWAKQHGEPGPAISWTALGCRYEAALALAETKDEQLLRDALAALTGLGADAAAHASRLGIAIPVSPGNPATLSIAQGSST